MKVGQLMRQQVQTCRAQDTLNVAAKLMWDHDCGCAPVVDDEGHVIGMITDRDICMAAYTQGKPLAALRVEGAMSKEVCSCRPEDTVAQAQKVMRTSQVHRLPVTDAGGRLVGILSLNDVAEEARRQHGAKKREVTYAEVGETLEAVCRPRNPRMVAVAA